MQIPYNSAFVYKDSKVEKQKKKHLLTCDKNRKKRKKKK